MLGHGSRSRLPSPAHRPLFSLLVVLALSAATGNALRADDVGSQAPLLVSRELYLDRMQGFWLGQCIANWTGLVTEMDKIGGEGLHGEFYTRDDWGKPDQPNIWSDAPSPYSPVIDWVFEDPGGIWGADDDTDIEYLYQHLLIEHETSVLTGEQIRAGWLTHMYSDADTPFRNRDGQPENFLWVSNQRAFDLMRERDLVPPATSAPENNAYFEMIDAQLSTEIFGLFAPGRPDIALRMAYLPIRTTARGEAALAAEFYVIMHALASSVDARLTAAQQVRWLAEQARRHLPAESYVARMYDFVRLRYESGVPWEQARDDVYVRYQVEHKDGYDLASRNLPCNGCFAAGINFAASMVSLFYGEGNFQETVRIAVLAGWDSDNPAATWGGLLGFLHGREALEKQFGRRFSERFHIHRTRRGFPAPEGIDTFPAMSRAAVTIVDRVVEQEAGGRVDAQGDRWVIPVAPRKDEFAHAIGGGRKPWTHERFDASGDKFTFAVFSDLTGGQRAGVFDVAVAQLNLLRPELIMNVGDLIEGDSNDEAGLNAEWDAFDGRANAATAPVFHVGGNHDLTGEMLQRVWEVRYGRSYYHFVYKNVLFLVLDTEDNTPERMQEIFELRNEALAIYRSEGHEAFARTEYAGLPERGAGTIGPEQSAYFRRVLADNPDVRWTFLFMHKPAWEKAGEQAFSAIEAALADRPYTVFHGHLHAYGYAERHGRDYIRLATTGGQQLPGAGRSVDHVTLVTVGDSGVNVVNLLMSGILDKTGRIPLGGDELCFESAVCGQ